MTAALTKRTKKSAANSLQHPKHLSCILQKKGEMLVGPEVPQPLNHTGQK